MTANFSKSHSPSIFFRFNDLRKKHTRRRQVLLTLICRLAALPVSFSFYRILRDTSFIPLENPGPTPTSPLQTNCTVRPNYRLLETSSGSFDPFDSDDSFSDCFRPLYHKYYKDFNCTTISFIFFYLWLSIYIVYVEIEKNNGGYKNFRKVQKITIFC